MYHHSFAQLVKVKHRSDLCKHRFGIYQRSFLKNISLESRIALQPAYE